MFSLERQKKVTYYLKWKKFWIVCIDRENPNLFFYANEHYKGIKAMESRVKFDNVMKECIRQKYFFWKTHLKAKPETKEKYDSRELIYEVFLWIFEEVINGKRPWKAINCPVKFSLHFQVLPLLMFWVYIRILSHIEFLQSLQVNYFECENKGI